MVYGASFQVREETDMIVVFEMLPWYTGSLYLSINDIIYHIPPPHRPRLRTRD
jgi:hypothetical protein